MTLILATIDRIKMLLDELERNQAEEAGDDQDLIVRLSAWPRPARRRGKSRRARHRGSRRAGRRCVRPDLAARLEAALPAALDAPADAGAARPAAAVPAPVAPAPADSGLGPERGDGGPATTIGSNDKIANKSIRVHVDTLEHLMTMVSELVLTRNQLLEIVRRHEDSEFKGPLQRLSNVTAELQEGVMKTRMQPIGNAWQKLPRIVRDLSTELGKPIELEMHGAETELDRQVLDLIKDPLTHMVRNSADHGLEMPAAAARRRQAREGHHPARACHEGGHIMIEISDDGRGLDTERIKATAIARGLATQTPRSRRCRKRRSSSFIFAPGFSTAEKVTSVSGRGVGMDVVRANIDEIGGTIDVKSVLGRGTTLHHQDSAHARDRLRPDRGIGRRSLRHPAARGGRAGARAQQFGASHRAHQGCGGAAPAQQAAAARSPQGSARRSTAGADCQPENGFIVVTQVGSQTFGIVVDAVFHTEEIVVKPMSSKLRHIPLFSGNTILGDGSVIMIIDPNGIAQSIGNVVIERDGRRGRAGRRAAGRGSRHRVDAGVPRRLAATPRRCCCRW